MRRPSPKPLSKKSSAFCSVAQTFIWRNCGEFEIIAVEDLALGVRELAEIGVPARGRVQDLGGAVIVNDRKARAGRAVARPGSHGTTNASSKS